MAEKILSADYLRSVLNYNPLTGVFTRLVSTNSRVKVGDVAGCDNGKGYMVFSVLGRLYQAHRIAWLYMHGQWPDGNIDHIDGNPSNNAIANLRDVSQSVNMQNQRLAMSHNTSGYLGVSRNGKRWQAEIQSDGKRRPLGTHDTPVEAHAAYLEAKRRLHPGCTI